MVAPSGLLAAPKGRPPGSNKAGTPADLKAIARILLMEACLDALSALRWQDMPWKPSGATRTPQEQVCEDTTGHSTRKPTATLNSSSPKRSPREGDGRAPSQQPEPGAAAASIETLPAPSVPLRREPNCALQTGSSKPFCATGIGLGAIVSSPETNQDASVSAITDGNGPRRPGCIKASTSGKEAIEDAKNAGTAKEDTDLTPKPPHRTGR